MLAKEDHVGGQSNTLAQNTPKALIFGRPLFRKKIMKLKW